MSLTRRCCCFFKRRKRKTTQRHKWPDVDRPGELLTRLPAVPSLHHLCSDHMYFQRLTLRNSSVVHTSFCGCLTFIFLSNLTFMEALRFCQNMSALPISVEWTSAVGLTNTWTSVRDWRTQLHRTFPRSSSTVENSTGVPSVDSLHIIWFFYVLNKNIIKQEFSSQWTVWWETLAQIFFLNVLEKFLFCDICIDFSITDGTVIHESYWCSVCEIMVQSLPEVPRKKLRVWQMVKWVTSSEERELRCAHHDVKLSVAEMAEVLVFKNASICITYLYASR